MAKRHGRRLRLWVEGYRISPDVSRVEESYTTDMAQITVVEDDDHQYVPGIRGGEMRITGWFDDTDGHVDDVLSEVSALGDDGNDVLIVRHNAQGAAGYAGVGGLSRDYGIQGPHTGPVAVTASLLFTGVARRVLVASAYQTVTAAGTVAASLDLGAGSAPNGGQVYIQCDSISGTVTVEVFHGGSDLAETNSFGSVTFTEGTGPLGTALALVTTAVGRYITSVWTPAGGGGTAAFITAFGLRRPGPDE